MSCAEKCHCQIHKTVSWAKSITSVAAEMSLSNLSHYIYYLIIKNKSVSVYLVYSRHFKQSANLVSGYKRF
jgi:hypothetical protein